MEIEKSKVSTLYKPRKIVCLYSVCCENFSYLKDGCYDKKTFLYCKFSSMSMSDSRMQYGRQ